MSNFKYLLLFLFSTSLSAQDSTRLYRNFIKYSSLNHQITTLLIPIRTVQFGYEHKLNKHFSTQNDFGFVANYKPRTNGNGKIIISEKGIIMKSEFRYYLGKRYMEKRYITNWYFCPQLMYQNLIAVVRYSYNYRYTVFRDEYGLHFIIGHQKITTSRLVWDLGVGLGARYISIKNNDTKGFAERKLLQEPWIKFYEFGRGWFFSITTLCYSSVPLINKI